jgi:hypothetical protein
MTLSHFFLITARFTLCRLRILLILGSAFGKNKCASPCSPPLQALRGKKEIGSGV